MDCSLFSSEVLTVDNILLTMTFFVFPKVKWPHLTGEVDKPVRFSYQIFSRFNTPKLSKMGNF